MTMFNPNKIIAASVAVICLSAAGIAAVSSASGSPTERPHVAALTAGQATTPPANVTAGLSSADAADRGADTSKVRAIVAAGATWYLAPTNDGACLVTQGATVTCASAHNVNAGSLVSIELAGAIGAGGKLQPNGEATLRGIAPDGVAKVTVADASGKTLGTALVKANAYSLSVAGLNPGSQLTFVDSRGNTANWIEF